jgi:hypothetical protein
MLEMRYTLILFAVICHELKKMTFASWVGLKNLVDVLFFLTLQAMSSFKMCTYNARNEVKIADQRTRSLFIK